MARPENEWPERVEPQPFFSEQALEQVFAAVVSVEPCSLARTGDSGCSSAGAGSRTGDPSNEEGISSITGDPCLVELLLIP